jgi:ribosomal protein S6--L-glutamate ligase
MRVVILAYTPGTYATRQLVAHGRARGHEVSVVSPLDCTVDVSGATVHHEGKPLAADAVLLRGMTFMENGVLVPRELETSVAVALARAGAVCLPGPEAKRVTASKLASLERLATAGLPVPRTVVGWSAPGFEAVLEALGTPLVFKALDGTWGVGVSRCDSIASARSVWDLLRSRGIPFLVQRYIQESGGETLRALVVGEAVVGGLRARPRPGDFRSNVSRGGAVEAVTLAADDAALALAATRALGLPFAGVDLVQAREGSLVLEVNSVPGLEAMDVAHAIESSQLILDLVERAREAPPGR